MQCLVGQESFVNWLLLMRQQLFEVLQNIDYTLQRWRRRASLELATVLMQQAAV
jgi:hypothetical protein